MSFLSTGSVAFGCVFCMTCVAAAGVSVDSALGVAFGVAFDSNTNTFGF